MVLATTICLYFRHSMLYLWYSQEPSNDLVEGGADHDCEEVRIPTTSSCPYLASSDPSRGMRLAVGQCMIQLAPQGGL